MGHLTMAKDEVYRALAERLGKNPVGAVVNETLMKILYILYGEPEAAIGSKFPMRPATIGKISEKTGFSIEELKVHLEKMAQKGLVADFPRKGETLYHLSPLVVGWFEYTFMRVTDRLPMADLARLFNDYHHEKGVAEEFFGAETKMFNVLPYEDHIPPEVQSEVLTYERASQMIRDSGGGSLSMCYCRHQARHMGKACDNPVEDVCTSLGKASEFLIRRGFARPAAVDELLRVLEKTESLGLVHIGDNVRNNPAFICHCCGCCCGVLRSINESGIMSVHPGNFIPLADHEKCAGCGICAQRCHIGAIEIIETVPGDKKSRRAFVKEDLCIGCGVCLAGCKKESIGFIRRKTIHIPPKNTKEQMMQIAAQKERLKNFIE
ncbi:MAG: (Fe-S)-binding protein [Actinobacteria bacterium]|nr:(Fe-S)-binding protein [Actinomycetota bacterium]